MAHVFRTVALAALALATAAPAAHAQLSWAWMVPAAAHAPGAGDTYWYTDLSLHNPHEFDLPVVIFFLPSNRDNLWSSYLEVTLYPWETLNLWDALGPDVFNWSGSGALLVYADQDRISCPSVEACAFGVFSRTYTPDPLSSWGEFGQGIPGLSPDEGLDWDTFGYAGGILSDDGLFRCNAGVASWTPEWVTVNVDVQNSQGSILATEVFEVPPYGHLQRRLHSDVSGGALVFYIVDGPPDALVFPYASVVNETTGDPTFLAAEPSAVGVSVTSAKEASKSARSRGPERLEPIAVQKLRERARPSPDTVRPR